MFRIVKPNPIIIGIDYADGISEHDHMSKLKPGDRVACKVRAGHIVNAYEGDWDEKYTFEVVATDNRGYYLFIPHYIYIKGGLKVNEYNRKTHGIDKRFLGETIVYIAEGSVLSVEQRADGLICEKCKEFSPMAECDEPPFICWICRTYPYR